MASIYSNIGKANYKKSRVFRAATGHFLLLKCADCEDQTVCYSHSQAHIKCKVCSGSLMKPTGGMAKVMNKARSKIAENIY